jgi:hypothetical protein
VEIRPGILSPGSGTARPAVNRFYDGEYDTSIDRQFIDIQNMEKAVSFFGGELAYVAFDAAQNAHILHFRDQTQPTGLFSPATSILVDEEAGFVWVAGDVRVVGFSLITLAVEDILYVREDLVWKSSLALWGEWLVLGTGKTIFFWPRIAPDDSKWKVELPSRTEYRDMSKRRGLNQALVDWRKDDDHRSSV